ncbi:hypothetical protein AB0I84_13225 [Streptomyces spectabilis]|uniref:hypothetical protein n=1 Tax=Streptomyces spectabilis TaxID=68270 RepID=UPI0033EC996B
MAKRASSPYRAGRIWQKIRHSETVDADVVGYTGSARQPRALAVRLPDGRTVLSQRLTAALAAQAAAWLREAPGRQVRTDGGDAYTTVPDGLVVEVLAGTTRHKAVTVTRVR